MDLDYQHVGWSGGSPGQGSPYWTDRATGERKFIPPMSAASDSDPALQKWAADMGVKATYNNGQIQGIQDTGRPGGGIFHESGTWNGSNGQWDQPIDWGNVLSLAVGGGLGAGALSAAGAFSGAGMGAADVGTGAGMSGPMAATTGGAGAAAGGAGAAGAAGGAAGLGSLSPAVKALMGIGSAVAGRVTGSAMQDQAVPPQLQQLLDIGMQRSASQTPLFNAVNQGAYTMLPSFAKTPQAVPRG